MVLIALLIAIVAAILFNTSFSLPRLLENVIAIPILVMAQIVLLSQILSILHLLTTSGYWVGQVICLMISVVIWWLREKPSVSQHWIELWQPLKTGRWRSPYLMILAVFILAFIGYRAWYGAIYETYFFDAWVYHIPRALFWLQNGTAEHFFTENFRLTEFPPNASFVYTWMVAISGHTLGLNLPQAIATLVVMMCTTALARQAAFDWKAAIFAGLLSPFPFELAYQIGEAQIDIITSALTATMILFVVLVMKHYKEDDRLWANNALIYLAIAFGLAVGTKFTAVLFLPGVAFAFLAIALGWFKQRAIQVLSACAIASVIGFVILGAYNYGLNLQSFGDPFSSLGVKHSSDLINRQEVPLSTLETLTDPAANLVRYLFQIVTIEIVPIGGLIDLKISIYDFVFTQLLGIDYTVDGTPITEFDGLRIYFVYFAIIVFTSIGWLCWDLNRSRHSEEHALRAAYIFCAWAWIVALSIVTVWSPWKMRLFIVIIPFLMAAVLPRYYPTRLLSWRWLITGPILFFVGLNVLLMLVFQEEPPTQLDTYLAVELAPRIADAETIGFIGSQVPVYHIMSRFPDKTYQFVLANELEQMLQSGTLDRVLADEQTCNQYSNVWLIALEQAPLLFPYCIISREALGT